jgi:hypothetical protein
MANRLERRVDLFYLDVGVESSSDSLGTPATNCVKYCSAKFVGDSGDARTERGSNGFV